ncbi:hypothetical protein M427DRAFT_205266 [Gonapodya prolifera JEL478]|uniref:Uncharacterized protein n=1 Tax=Gonapodya prolifera (strain JEL478) TaxID=1344416 RepID=A0A138ZZE0_GONPJ|nr:hypothetical protein M427DRAFT_205266 [Gonapodya prolifera JEL478]|eukprot:KXS09877.1 hypothetical protein M427DRAFT_205266 [Gonapodya prolifera JEL478]
MLTSILPGLVLHERRRVVVQATLARVDLSGLAERICEGVDRLRSSRRDGEASGSRTEHDQPIVRDRFSVSPARSATAPLSPSTPQRPSTTDVITVPLSDFTDVPVRRDPSSRGGPSTNHGTRSGGGDRSGRASGSGMDADEDEFVDAIEGVSCSSGSSSRPRPVPATQAGEENAVVMCKYVPRVMSYHVFPRPADARELSTEQAPVVFTLVSIAQPHIRLQALVGANMKYFETKNGTPLALAGDITILWSLLVVLRGVMEPHEWRRCLVMVQKMRTYVETDASRSSVPAHSVMTDLVGTVTGKVMETVERVASSKVMCVVDFVRDDAEPDQFGTEYRLGNDAQVLGRMSGSDRVRCMVSQIYRVEVLD